MWSFQPILILISFACLRSILIYSNQCEENFSFDQFQHYVDETKQNKILTYTKNIRVKLKGRKK